MKRAILVLLLVLAGGTVPSGATYTASSGNPQSFGAAADFGVHVEMTGPTGPVGGTPNVSANASETAGGTITQVEFQSSAPGAESWTTICTDTNGAPWQCPWPTSGNGSYDLRARARSSSGYTRVSATLANRIVDNSPPTATFNGPSAWFGGTVALSVSDASDTGGSGFAGVTYEYKLSSASTWTSACTGAGATYSCNFNSAAAGLTNGSYYDFRATASDGAGNQTHYTLTNRRADNALPGGSLNLPATNLRGSVAIPTTGVTDGHSGVASIAVQYSVAGAGSWSDACLSTTGTPSWSCTWDTTTVTSQVYDLRLIVRDVAGNQRTSPTLANRRVDNVLPDTTLTVPTGVLSATVNMSATATDSGSGVRDVAFQRSLTGAASWTNACPPDATGPSYTCSFNTATVPDALYDLRSLATDNAGNERDSIVTRRIDNNVPSAADVQTADGGGTPGVIQTGDTMTLTYSEQIDPATIIAGWNGTGSQSIHIRISHHNQGDRLLFYNSANSAVIPLGTSPGVVLEEDYVPSSDATFTGTLTQNGSSFTVTLGTRTLGNVNATAPPASTMNWFPHTSARDFLAKACTSAQRQETGAADVEF